MRKIKFHKAGYTVLSADWLDAGPIREHGSALPGRSAWTYTIFEGTSEIQRLVIARASSGIHIQ